MNKLEDLIGARLGPYEIREKIGQGGMAYVFKAYQPALKRFVAVKVLLPSLAQDPKFTERFQKEAHAVAHLHHPNILQVYDFGVEDNYHYIVMHYVTNSVTLETVMKQGISIDKLINYTLQVADALNYAHEQGIIHRDVKPSNILIENERAFLSDFGLVKNIGQTSHLTATDAGLGQGTPAYMSPEQAQGSSVDHRTDIYALGVILYQILTGAIPHDAPFPWSIMAKRTQEPVLPPRQVNPNVSESMELVTLKALVREPDYRYQTATEFAQSLQHAQHAQKEPVRPEENPMATSIFAPSELTPPPTKTKRSASFIAGGIITVAIIGLLLWARFFFGGFGSRAAQPAMLPNTATKSDVSLAIVETELPTATPLPLTATPTPTTPFSGTPFASIKTELGVWSGPDEAYDLLGYLPAQAKVEITSRDRAGEWWQIKTSLSPAGIGWIKVNDDLANVANRAAVPIALVPPTATASATATPEPPTASPTVTHTPELPTATVIPSPTMTNTPEPAATATHLPSPTAKANVSPTPSPKPTLPNGEFLLLKPASLEEPSYGVTEFMWQWNGPVAENQGFEVRVWRDGEPPAGVHDAVLDNKTGLIESLGDNIYRLVVDITMAYGVRQRGGEYNWAVTLVQVEPEYKDLGIQASPGRLRFELPFDSGNNGSQNGGQNDSGGLVGGD